MKVLIFLSVFLYFCEGAKILVFIPELGTSHVKHLAKVSELLAQSHDVTAIISPMSYSDANVDHIKLARRIRLRDNKNLDVLNEIRSEGYLEKMWTNSVGSPFAIWPKVKYFQKLFATHCQGVMDNEEMNEFIRNEKFDLAMGELFDTCHFGMFKIWNIPTHIALGSGHFFSPFFKPFGLTFPITQVPEIHADYGNKGMGFVERALNLYYNFFSDQFWGEPQRLIQAMFDAKYGKDFVNLNEVIGDSAYYITNSEPLLNYAQNTLPKIIELGGMANLKVNALDKKWEDIMNLRNSTVLMSFGSVAKSYLMPLAWKQNILAVFKSFPDVTFIFKYGKEDGFGKGVDNVIISNEWLPQVDLLNHPKLSGFITHGGINSMQEGATAGKPLILVGLFGDQSRNAICAEAVGLGKALPKEHLINFDILKDMIEEVFIKNNKYKNEALRIKDILANQPLNKTEVFLRHVDFAAKYGSQKMLKMMGTDQNFVERNNLDIYFLIISGFGTILYFLICVIKKCIGSVTVSKNKKNE
uniref:Glucuronosyltransferase n=1 Tax=Rhabditophanes sp. KR3021 TaxID=114890 RepID=A0AC35TY26_9BILA